MFFGKILEMDPEGGLQSFYELMTDQVTMPACLMTDGKEDKLFDKFSVTAQKMGVCEYHTTTNCSTCLPEGGWPDPSLCVCFRHGGGLCQHHGPPGAALGHRAHGGPVRPGGECSHASSSTGHGAKPPKHERADVSWFCCRVCWCVRLSTRRSCASCQQDICGWRR